MARSTIKKTMETKETYEDTSAGIRYIKIGQVVMMNLELSSNHIFSGNAEETIFTIPEGYRPAQSISFRESLSNIRLQIQTNGIVSFSEAHSDVKLRGCVTYLT